MLGLALIVAILALVLSGTLRGLWSYYVTTNSIRAKLSELVAAEEFKEAVTHLVTPDSIDKLIKNSNQDLPKAMDKVRGSLKTYQEKLQDTLDHGRDPGQGVFEKEMIEQLQADLAAFEKAVAELWNPAGDERTDEQRKMDNLRALGVPGEEEKQENPQRKPRARQGPIERLLFSAEDLRSHIKDQLDKRLEESRRHYQISLWIIVPSSIVGLLILGGLMLSFYAWVFNPIRHLEIGVSRVAHGDLAHRIELHSGDEMEELACAFNDMMQRLQDLYSDLARQVNERSRQLVRSERLASVGFLAAGVAHEINNPLASIAFCSEALEARLDGLLRHLRATGRLGDEHEVFARYLKMIQEEAFRCKNITERLLAFSRSGERKREQADLRELVQSVLDVTQHLQNHKGKDIVVEVAERLPSTKVLAWVNGEEIKSVVLNLVVNALDSMEEGGRLSIRLSQRDGFAELRFTDTGCGMTQDVLENIFEPFFTRIRTGKGTGLGLTISHRIINQHGGEIEASSPGPNRGSTFTVRLPQQFDEGAEARPEPAVAPARAA
jgi:signal transduction histidine kinase